MKYFKFFNLFIFDFESCLQSLIYAEFFIIKPILLIISSSRVEAQQAITELGEGRDQGDAKTERLEAEVAELACEVSLHASTLEASTS